MVNQKNLLNISTEQLVIAIHTPGKMQQLMQNKPAGAEKVAVHRFKLGLIFYRSNGGCLEAFYTDTVQDWQETRSRNYDDLSESLTVAGFILCDVQLLEKELSLHGYSDKPIPLLDRVYSELGVMHESVELRCENDIQNKDYWNGYKAALEAAQAMITKFNT